MRVRGGVSSLGLFFFWESTLECICFILMSLGSIVKQNILFWLELLYSSERFTGLPKISTISQAKYFPELEEPIEFHASPLRPGGKGEAEKYNCLSTQQRLDLISEIFQVIRNRRGILFGCVIEKTRIRDVNECYARAYEDIVSRFDLFIRRYNRNLNDINREEQRGFLAIAESSYRRHLEILSEKFMGRGTRWGQIHAIAEVPFFLPAKSTRLLQIADFCANAIYARYEYGFTREFDIIAPQFDREGSRIHGLAHITKDHQCMCLACASRQASSQSLF